MSQFLHWSTAALVVVLIITGKAGDLDDEEGGGAFFWHSSVGALVFLLVLARLLWRVVGLSSARPARAAGWAGRLALAVHVTFYVLLIALPVSGWLAASADGGQVSFFGIASLPMASRAAAEGESVGAELHEILGNAMLVLVIVHALAALKHRFIDQDPVLDRMLPGERPARTRRP